MKRRVISHCRKGRMHQEPTSPAPGTRCRRLWRRYRILRFSTYVIASLLLAVFILAAAVACAPFDDARLRNLDVSTVVRDRDGQFLRAYLSRDDRWRIPADLDSITPWIVKATLAAEDKRFYNHHGLDLTAVARAMVTNLKAGRILSGASTITMQVAGFAIDSRERSLHRKFRQAFLALQLESRWSKREIIECYLTHASYGGNVCGVEAASRRYFNKTAGELSIGEAALLAGIPQSPEKFRPDRNLAIAMKRRQYVLDRLLKNNNLSVQDHHRISGSKTAIGTFEAPVRAPHFCDMLQSMYPSKTRLDTTLRLDFQNQAEQALSTVIRGARPNGITNGSVVILDNQSAEVLALVGSADYWNRFDQGQVNGALGLRSPGSTLKPFIYGLAMDANLLEPDEVLHDVPITVAGYSPLNYDREFRGPVSASRALALSLNIPAIEVLKRVGVGEIRDAFRGNNLSLAINPQGDPGLSLAIGTCSVRLLDLTSAYASLPRDGKVLKPQFLKTRPDTRPSIEKSWMSAAASRSILAALSDNNVRAPEDIALQLSGLKNIAWKTGTSNGFRDAWTIAVTPTYTVGVWIGNMDGHPSRTLVGGKIAAPLALGIALSIDKSSRSLLPADKDGMESHIACAHSGLAPGPQCIHTLPARFLHRSGAARKCDVHRQVPVDHNSGYEICPRCSTGTLSSSMKTVALYSADFTSWIRAVHYPWADELAPAHNPSCPAAAEGQGPTIVSPAPGSQLIYLTELPAEFQKIALTARTDDPAATLYWFMDGMHIGSAPTHDSVLILPQTGHHTIKCVDNRGRTSETDFSVETSARASKGDWSHLSDSN